MPQSPNLSVLGIHSLQGQVRTTGTQLGHVYKSDPIPACLDLYSSEGDN